MIRLRTMASLFSLMTAAGNVMAQSPTLKPQEPDGARQAAINSIATFKELTPNAAIDVPGAASHASTTGWSESKSNDAKSAKDELGAPLVDYTIDLNTLQSWDGKSVETLLRPTGQLVYSIRSGGAAKTSVTIAKLKDEWAPISFGTPDEAQARDRINGQLARVAGTKIQPIQVRIPSLHATFLGQQISGKWQFTPIESQQELGLKAGKIERAEKVLLRIQPAAKKLDLNTPG